MGCGSDKVDCAVADPAPQQLQPNRPSYELPLPPPPSVGDLKGVLVVPIDDYCIDFDHVSIPLESCNDTAHRHQHSNVRHQSWNVFLVDREKSYVLSRVDDDPQHVFRTLDAVWAGTGRASGGTDKVGSSFKVSVDEIKQVDRRRLKDFMDNSWTRVLSGKSLHSYIFIIDALFQVSAFPVINGGRQVTGGVMLMWRVSRSPAHALLLPCSSSLPCIREYAMSANGSGGL
jgi:hypothetical protein